LDNKKIYFFSDVHLGLKSRDEEKQKEKRVVSFLNQIRPDAAEIFIVGDLFDCWIEYRKVVPKGYYRILAKLNEIIESGININFVSGNHDFWLNTYLRDDVGLKIFYEPIEREISGKKFFISHGDGLSKGDIGYKVIKKILRNKINQFLYSLIHPDIGITLAKASSKKSRDHTENKIFIDKGMQEFAEKKISQGFDFVIMGHVHKPFESVLTVNGRTGLFVVLGDWIMNNTYGVFSGSKFELKHWDK
jgi:UDP-2,3-diacylglucosamine hydrolase